MRERRRREPRFDGSQYPMVPVELKDPHFSRRVNCAERQYSKMGLTRENAEGRFNYVFNNMQFFGAPVGMFCFIENTMGNSQWADLGSYIQTFMLLLREVGLDSCAQISWCNYAQTVREFFAVPDHWILYCGMSIGYADPDAIINTVVRGPCAARGDPQVRHRLRDVSTPNGTVPAESIWLTATTSPQVPPQSRLSATSGSGLSWSHRGQSCSRTPNRYPCASSRLRSTDKAC